MKPYICILIIGLIILFVIIIHRLCSKKDSCGEKPHCKGAICKKGRWICPTGCIKEEKPLDCEYSICINERWICLDAHNQKICKDQQPTECDSGSPVCVDGKYQCLVSDCTGQEPITCDNGQTAMCIDGQLQCVTGDCSDQDPITCNPGEYALCVNGQLQCVTGDCSDQDPITCDNGEYALCVNGQLQCVTGDCSDQDPITCDNGEYALCVNGQLQCVTGDCNPASMPICKSGYTAVCVNGSWECVVGDCTGQPPTCESGNPATCVNGQWGCVVGDCTGQEKPTCNMKQIAICVNDKWKCGTTVNDCNSAPSSSLVCPSNRKPVCINGDWRCGTIDKYYTGGLINQSAKGVNYYITALVTTDPDPFGSVININYITNTNINLINIQNKISNIESGLHHNTTAYFTNNFTFSQFIWSPKINPYPIIGLDVPLYNFSPDVVGGQWSQDTIFNLQLIMFDTSTMNSMVGTVSVIAKMTLLSDNWLTLTSNVTNSCNYKLIDYTTKYPSLGSPWVFNDAVQLKDVMNVGFCMGFYTNDIVGVNGYTFLFDTYPNNGVIVSYPYCANYRGISYLGGDLNFRIYNTF